MKIGFHIPDFLKHFRLHMILIQAMEHHPEWFRDGVYIASVYGAFPPSAWNGGRNIYGECDDRTITEVLKAFNSKGIPCRYTFTNPLVTEEHLDNEFCNKVMRMGENGLNEVIVNSPVLEAYIREKYPRYKITSSTCKQIRNIDDLKAELEKDYYLVVLDYNWNNNFEFLEQLPHKEKCEILINACCTPECKRRGEHYRTIGADQLQYDRERMHPQLASAVIQRANEFECPYMNLTLYDTVGFKTHITPDALYGKYAEMGYSQFKIEGRTLSDVIVLENYVYYMVKPEFKDVARLDMLNRLTSKVKYFR